MEFHDQLSGSLSNLERLQDKQVVESSQRSTDEERVRSQPPRRFDITRSSMVRRGKDLGVSESKNAISVVDDSNKGKGIAAMVKGKG